MTKKITIYGKGKNRLSLRKRGGGALERHKGRVPKQRTQESSLFQKAEKFKNEIDVVIGIDFTASTSHLIEEFKSLMSRLVTSLNREFPIDFHFGRYDGNGSQIVSSMDNPILQERNVMGNSNVPKFLKEVVDQRLLDSSKNAVVFLAGDELAWDENGFSEKDLQSVINYFKEMGTNLFFLYEQSGGTSKDFILEKLIKPLGEQGVLLDFSETSLEQLLEVAKGCLAYTVETKALSVINKPSAKRISLKSYLKKRIGQKNIPLITSGK